ncbi:MAG: hypothetical protein WKF55_12520 [Gemmatimonadaceae bacterium]
MSWIRLTIASVALCASASAAEAQGAPGGRSAQGSERGAGAMRGRMQAMLFEGITLTSAQQDQLTVIRRNAAKARQEHMPDGAKGGPPDPAMRKMMMEMQAKQQAEMRAVLTADQRTIFDRNVAAMKSRQEQRKANRSKS